MTREEAQRTWDAMIQFATSGCNYSVPAELAPYWPWPQIVTLCGEKRPVMLEVRS